MSGSHPAAAAGSAVAGNDVPETRHCLQQQRGLIEGFGEHSPVIGPSDWRAMRQSSAA